MGHYIVELAIWTFLAYFIGCFIGWLLHRMFGGKERDEAAVELVAAPPPVVAEAKSVVAPKPLVVPVPPAAEPEPVVEPLPIEEEPVAEPLPAMTEPAPRTAPELAHPRRDRPKGLAEARAGKADNLQRISGIGPKNERVLHNLGFYHFDQIAGWSDEQIGWVDEHLRFNGRIVREQWVRQARLLANGEEDEFMRLFGANQPRQ